MKYINEVYYRGEKEFIFFLSTIGRFNIVVEYGRGERRQMRFLVEINKPAIAFSQGNGFGFSFVYTEIIQMEKEK